jgi:hypothetical protein
LLTKSFLNDKTTMGEVGGECGTSGEEGAACRVLVGKLEIKRPLGRTKLRC